MFCSPIACSTIKSSTHVIFGKKKEVINTAVSSTHLKGEHSNYANDYLLLDKKKHPTLFRRPSTVVYMLPSVPISMTSSSCGSSSTAVSDLSTSRLKSSLEVAFRVCTVPFGGIAPPPLTYKKKKKKEKKTVAAFTVIRVAHAS